jgi:hypothetical protein
MLPQKKQDVFCSLALDVGAPLSGRLVIVCSPEFTAVMGK